MFTGLVKELRPIADLSNASSGRNLVIEKPESWNDLELGESITVNGICLSLTKVTAHEMIFFAGEETLAKTSASVLEVGEFVNLERSLRMGDRLGGHLVSGHIDGVATVTEVLEKDQCLEFKIKIPQNLMGFMIQKGSLAIQGVSLTINTLDKINQTAGFYLIPETLERTNLKNLKLNQKVNIECDQVVKIISQQVEQYRALL